MSSHPVSRRRIVGLVAAVASMTASAALPLAGPAGAAEAHPELDGTVKDKGTKDVSGSSTAKVTVKARDFSLGPTYLKVDPGEQITFTVKNTGRNPHTFTSDDLDFDARVSPGKTKKVSVTVPTSGDTFEFYCSLHRGSGMRGALFTSAAATVTGSGSSSGTSKPSAGAGTYDY